MTEPHDIEAPVDNIARWYRAGLQDGYAGHEPKHLNVHPSAWGRATMRAYEAGLEHGRLLRSEEQREAGGMH